MNHIEKQQFVFGNILLLSNKLQIVGDRVLADLTLKQFFLLVMMHNMENKEPSVKEIADFTGTTRQNTKKMLLPLEKKGYVTVDKSSTDSRALCVSLTQKSYDYFKEHEKYGEMLTEKLFGDIETDDLDATIRVLQKMMEHSMKF